MFIKKESLELVAVEYNERNTKCTLTFFDEDEGSVYEVSLNKQAYREEEWVDDPEKAARIEEIAMNELGFAFDKLGDAVGVKHDIFAYENFNSLNEVELIKKPSLDDVGMIIPTKIESIEVDDYSIKIRFRDDEGDLCQSKITTGTYVESIGRWAKNPQKEAKGFGKFEKKFGVPVEDREDLIGKDIMVELKSAFGKFAYYEIKPIVQKKGKK